jgi:predicted amidohydrolase
MSRTLRLACVQLNAQEDFDANIAACSGFIRQAAAAGAELIATPENTGCMQPSSDRVLAAGRSEAEHPALAAYRALAAELGRWLSIGSLWIREGDEPRIRNRQFLIRPDGTIAARYDKIHMFDVDLANGESYRESKSFAPGALARTVDTPWGLVGLTICYDVRFPHLYRRLGQAGAALISIPAAFTRTTGMAHWHVLQRARAIETGAFVFAAAQCGEHPGKRRTYGHSLIVDPWGQVLADGGEEPGFIVADLDLAKVAEARGNVPAWKADRDFELAP